MIDYDYLDKVIEIEQDYQCNHSIWELITSTFEMIRKALKWDDLFEPEFHKLAQKLSKIFKIISERISQYGLSLVMAETLSELINITNILLNTHPSWIVEGCNKYEFTISISGIYKQMINLFDTISDLGLSKYFDEESECKNESGSFHRDKSMMSSSKRSNSNSRITCLVSNFKRSTLCPQNELEDDNNSFVIPLKTLNEHSSKQKSYPQFSRVGSNSPNKKKSIKKISYDKNKDLNYEQGSLIDFIINDEDPFSANIILQCFKFLNILVENLSGNVKLQLPLFKSGIIWRQLLFLMQDFSSWPLPFMLEPSTIEKLCCSCLRFLFSNCDYIIKHKSLDKEETKEQIDISKDEEILIEHYKMCQSLIGYKSVEKLVSKVSVKESGSIEILDDFDLFPFFIEIYKSQQHTSPDLIWNQRTRDELKMILQKEIEEIESGESNWEVNPYNDYCYTEYSKELRVDGVFIRLLNKDIYHSHRNPSRFLHKLVETIFKIKNDISLSYEVLTALRSLISNPIIESVSTDLQKQLIQLIPTFINIENSKDDNAKFAKISSFVIDIVGQSLKKCHHCDDFFEKDGICDTLVNLLYRNKNELIPIESLISCINAISTWPQANITEYLWNSGILGLLFRYIFYTNEIRAQVKVINYFLCNTNQNIINYGKILIDSFLPLDFSQVSVTKSSPAIQPEFGSAPRQRGTSMTRKNHYINLHGDEFEEKSVFTRSAEDIIEQELERMNQEFTESVRAVWSSDITKIAKQTIDDAHFEKFKNEAKRVEDCEKKFINPLMQKEIVVDGVILRLYNMKSVKSVQVNNEQFLKSLLYQLKLTYNEYIIKSAYVTKINKESISDEEDKHSSDNEIEDSDQRYLSANSISELKYNNLNPECIEEYKISIQYLESKLIVILSSMLINISNCVLNKNERAESDPLSPSNSRSSSQNIYSISFLERLIKSEISNGLLKILSQRNPIQLRCTLLQICMLSPGALEMKPFFDYLRLINKESRNCMIENQILISIITCILLENDEKVADITDENFEILSKIALKCETTCKIVELVLNHIHKGTRCTSQLKDLKSRETHINWMIVEDASDPQLSSQSSFGMTKQHRLSTFYNIWKKEDNYSEFETLEQIYSEIDEIMNSTESGDIEAGPSRLSQKDILKIRLPIFSRKAFEKCE